MVCIHRIWGLGYAFVTWKAILNNDEVGTIRNGGYLNLELGAGNYKLQFVLLTLLGEALYEELFEFELTDNQDLQLDFKFTNYGKIEFINKKKKFTQTNKKNQYKEEKANIQFTHNRNDHEILSNHIHFDSYEVVSIEEFPVDNSEGSDVIFIEHEFSKTVTNEVQFEGTNDLSIMLGVDFLKIFQMEISKSISHKIGTTIGETVSKKHTVSFNVKTGEKMKFIITWKRKNSIGECLLKIENEKLKIPYQITYDLVYEIKTEKLKN